MQYIFDFQVEVGDNPSHSLREIVNDADMAAKIVEQLRGDDAMIFTPHYCIPSWRILYVSMRNEEQHG